MVIECSRVLLLRHSSARDIGTQHCSCETRPFQTSTTNQVVDVFAGRVEEGSFQKFANAGVGSGIIGLFILARLQATICVGDVARCCIGTFSRHGLSYQSGPPQKAFVPGYGFDTFQCVSPRLVVICVNIISDGVQRVSALLGVVLTFVRQWVWSLFRVAEIIFSDGLFPHDFCFVNWCCGGTNSGLNTGFQSIFHAAALVGAQNTLLSQVANIVNPAPPSCSHPPQKNSFFMISGSAPSFFFPE